MKNNLHLVAILALLSTISAYAQATKEPKADDSWNFNPGTPMTGGEWVQAITIKTPALRSQIKGNVRVELQAPAMTSARALCWQQPTKQDKNPFGHDVVVADLKLDTQGDGAFVFPADRFPNGPISLRILTRNEAGQRDIRELQLYNTGGIKWNQGIPQSTPPGAEGLKLSFADDFDKPPAISNGKPNSTYYSHKPDGGDFSGWYFSDYESPNNPFRQVGTFLRIRASKTPANPHGSTGLLSSALKDGSGFYMHVPFYAECRFTAQSAPGTWPAFWTLAQKSAIERDNPSDELHVIEGYGGVGAGNPNHPGYSITSHFWGQKAPDGTQSPDFSKVVPMTELGGHSYWSTTFHTYGVRVTEADTVYYLDNIEVLRHPTGALSKSLPTYFLINYAIGGISGWKIDLEREGNASDMFVDYVRVYEGK